MIINIKCTSDSTQFNQDLDVDGVIYLENSEVCYPEKLWSDNILIVMKWWVYTPQQISANEPNQGLHFMEGPYGFDVHVSGSECILTSVDGDIEWRVPREKLISQVKIAANSLVRQLRDKGGDEIVESLSIALSRLQRDR